MNKREQIGYLEKVRANYETERGKELSPEEKVTVGKNSIGIAQKLAQKLRELAEEELNWELYKDAAGYFSSAAFTSAEIGDTRTTAKLLTKSAKCYEDAKRMTSVADIKYRNIDRENEEKSRLADGLYRMLTVDLLGEKARVDRSWARHYRKKAALDKVTEKMNPLKKAIVRKLKSRKR